MKFAKILVSLFLIALFIVLFAFIIDMQIKSPIPLGLVLGAGLAASLRAVRQYKRKNVTNDNVPDEEKMDDKLHVIDKYTLDKS